MLVRAWRRGDGQCVLSLGRPFHPVSLGLKLYHLYSVIPCLSGKSMMFKSALERCGISAI